jgi:hypothetical protein
MTKQLETGMTPEQAALHYAAQGLYVFPIYEITEDGACACGGRPRCKPGKHPRTAKGDENASVHPDAIRGWWRMWPNAAIGVNLELSGLVDVAPDHPDHLAEFERRGVVTPARFQSPGGEGHIHHLFRRQDACPVWRICRTGEYDILSNGYAILPPSTGKDGRRYRWLADVPDLNGGLPPAPAWVVAALAEAKTRRAAPVRVSAETGEIEDEPPIPLNEHQIAVWRGAIPILKPDGEIDRSASLLRIGRMLWNAGMTRAGVIAAVAERDQALGWDKYSDRGDATTRYAEIGDLLEAGGHDPTVILNPSPPKATRRQTWPAPLIEAAYHGLAGDLIRLADPCTEADPAAVLLTFLAMAGNAVGRSPHLTFGTEIHRCNIYIGLVGASGSGRKGTSLGPGRVIIGGADPGWAASRIANGLVSGEGVIYQVRDAASDESGGADGWKIVKASKVKDGGVQDKRLLCIETELGGLLTAMHRQGSTLSHVLRAAWDGQKIQSLSKNAPVSSTGAHISTIGHITPEELRTALTSVDAANGFGNRFLWGLVRRSKVLPRPPAFEGPAVDALIQDLREVLDYGAAVGSMRLDAETGDAYDAYYRALPDDPPGLAGVMAVRMPAFVLRLSMIYALLDMTATIQRPHFEAALEVVRFCQDSARAIFGEMTGDPIADRIYEALQDGPLSKKQILHDVFSRNVPAPVVAAALKVLERAGLAYPMRVNTAGRPAEVWSVW